jgi:hypothetical protein
MNVVAGRDYPTGWDMCIDQARRWLTACGQGGSYFAIQELKEFSDEQLADKCIRCWCLDEPEGADNGVNWFKQNQADREMLTEAFAIMRKLILDA